MALAIALLIVAIGVLKVGSLGFFAGYGVALLAQLAAPLAARPPGAHRELAARTRGGRRRREAGAASGAENAP